MDKPVFVPLNPDSRFHLRQDCFRMTQNDSVVACGGDGEKILSILVAGAPPAKPRCGASLCGLDPPAKPLGAVHGSASGGSPHGRGWRVACELNLAKSSVSVGLWDFFVSLVWRSRREADNLADVMFINRHSCWSCCLKRNPRTGTGVPRFRPLRRHCLWPCTRSTK